MLPVNIFIPLEKNVTPESNQKSTYEYIRVYVVMLLFNIMYSYIISIFIIYLWYNYFFLFFRLLLKQQVFYKQRQYQIGLLSGNMGLQ